MSSLIEPFTGQEIQRWQLKPGDHIYTWRAFVYGHHGIYMGDEKVIQFSFARGQIPEVLEAVIHLLIRKKPCNKCGGLLNRTSNGVLITCLDCFLAGGKIYRYRYSISDHERRNTRAGTCTTADSDPPEKVLERAKSIIEEGFDVYHLIKNNCEDFALYCKTGKKITECRSGQTKEVVALLEAPASVAHAVRQHLREARRNKKEYEDRKY